VQVDLNGQGALTIGFVEAVLIGKAKPYTRPGSRSAIEKLAQLGNVIVTEDGFVGDEQADRRVHGGPDKAVHCYPQQHYAVWQQHLGDHPLLGAPGAFGENLSVVGPDENTVCIGDRWRIGSAQFEVSQGRQPCWKLNDRFQRPEMSRMVQDTLLSGWYLRVVEPGCCAAGDTILRTACPHPQWPLARVQAMIRDRITDRSELEAVLKLPLPASWEKLFRKRLQSGQIESWVARLFGGTD
jgi:MOSC domain-containing protein YiiM